MTTIDLSLIHNLVEKPLDQYGQTFGAANVETTLSKYGISASPLRVCHFMAQILAETGGLRALIENLNYSASQLRIEWTKLFPTIEIAQEYEREPEKLGNFVYANRLGNGDPASGDGYKYRGRGLLQITGKDAYTRFGKQLNIPLAENPDLAFDPAHCLEIAAAEWAVSGYKNQYCNALADQDDIYGVTHAINGGLTGIDARIAWLKRCKDVWLPNPALASRGLSFTPVQTAHVDANGAVRPYVKQPEADGAPPPAICSPYFKRPRRTLASRIPSSARPWEIGDLCKAYNWPINQTGDGVIAIVELDGGFTPQDMTAFFARIGQPAPSITEFSIDGAKNNPGQHIGQEADPDIEVTMDIQVAASAYSLATGKPASIRVYWAPNQPGAIAKAVRQAAFDKCDTCSISWGADEGIWKRWATSDIDYIEDMESAAQEALKAGMIVFAASGDNDASDGGENPANVDVPSSCPSVIGCGGTTKTALSETVWNNDPGKPDGEGTGGGYSDYFPPPVWQVEAPQINQNPPRRMVPDVAANADPNSGYNLLVHNQYTNYGGTSAVAPLYAGLFAAFGKKLALAPVASKLWMNEDCFNDITSGENGLFHAMVGPDPCTGLGSPIGSRLAALFARTEVQVSAKLDQAATFKGEPFDPVVAVELGLFVEAAYSMYNANPTNLLPEPGSNFPSGYRLAAWVQMRDFIVSESPLIFYGFVAQSLTEPNKFVMAIRGTQTPEEWWDNLVSILRTPFSVQGCGSVALGFDRIYQTLEIIERPTEAAGAALVPRSLRPAGSFAQQAASLTRRLSQAASAHVAGVSADASMTVVGHSLGSALATLYTMENAHGDKIHNPMICTFASPLVGDAAFVSAFAELPLTSWRIANAQDVVTTLPPELAGFEHIGIEQKVDSSNTIRPSLGCWHAMATYLSLLDSKYLPDSDCIKAVNVQAAKALASPALKLSTATALAVVDMMSPATTYLSILKANGVTTVGRYYSIHKTKVLSAQEAKAISQAGLSIFVVYEDDSDVNSFDADSGTRHAQNALRCASAIGQPEGSAIYFAADFAANMEIVEQRLIPYFQAIQQVFLAQGSKFAVGVYSDGLACQTLLDRKLVKYTWLSASTSFPGTGDFYKSQKWNLAQGLTRTIKYGAKSVSVDPNKTTGDFGAFVLDEGRGDASISSFLVHTTPPQSDLIGGPAPWMDWMREHRGQIQKTGAKPTPFTIEVFSHTNFGLLQGYTPESCAATVCAALEETGYRSTHSAAAISYRDYGLECDLQAGCIVVFRWENGAHHVDFCDSIVDKDTVRGLGGNQGSELRDSDYSRQYIIATRWPVMD